MHFELIIESSPGYTFGIPDSVLGLTFLSISVTLPDIMASVLVVRKGYGDMAVCYVLGTNIFEVLVGLGLPWFIQTTIIKPGTTVELQSSGEGLNTILRSLVPFLSIPSIPVVSDSLATMNNLSS